MCVSSFVHRRRQKLLQQISHHELLKFDLEKNRQKNLYHASKEPEVLFYLSDLSLYHYKFQKVMYVSNNNNEVPKLGRTDLKISSFITQEQSTTLVLRRVSLTTIELSNNFKFQCFHFLTQKLCGKKLSHSQYFVV